METTLPRVKVVLVCDEEAIYRPKVRYPKDVFEMMKEEASMWDREHFCVLLLDSRHRALGLEENSVGTLAASLVHPREVFKAAILANASAIICVHNHPSGDTVPSREDRELTTRLSDAGQLIGIQLLDHIIVTGSSYFSFSEGDLLPKTTKENVYGRQMG